MKSPLQLLRQRMRLIQLIVVTEIYDSDAVELAVGFVASMPESIPTPVLAGQTPAAPFDVHFAWSSSRGGIWVYLSGDEAIMWGPDGKGISRDESSPSSMTVERLWDKLCNIYGADPPPTTQSVSPGQRALDLA